MKTKLLALLFLVGTAALQRRASPSELVLELEWPPLMDIIPLRRPLFLMLRPRRFIGDPALTTVHVIMRLAITDAVITDAAGGASWLLRSPAFEGILQ